MESSYQTTNRRAVIHPTGRFDFSGNSGFRKATNEAVGHPDTSEICVDLMSVEYIDSAALGMLLILRDRALASRKTVTLAGARGKVKEVLDIANFTKLFAFA